MPKKKKNKCKPFKVTQYWVDPYDETCVLPSLLEPLKPAKHWKRLNKRGK